MYMRHTTENEQYPPKLVQESYLEHYPEKINCTMVNNLRKLAVLEMSKR